MRDTYTLMDFDNPNWNDRAPYDIGEGIALSHIDGLHKGWDRQIVAWAFPQPDIVAYFQERKSPESDAVAFTIYIYEVNTIGCGPNQVETVHPTFRVIGTSFEGVIEVQACAHLESMPWAIADQMAWLQEYCQQRGWASRPKPERQKFSFTGAALSVLAWALTPKPRNPPMPNHATKPSQARKTGEALGLFAGRVFIAAVGFGIALAIYHAWVM